MNDDRDVAVIGPAPSTAPRTGRGGRTLREGSLSGIVGLADAADFPDVPDDVSTNKHTYLADAYAATNDSNR